MARKTIVILGGYGVFGRHIADQLAKDGAARVVVAGRDVNKGQACAETIGAEFARCDARDRDSLRGVLSGADLVVNAAGPFQDSEYLAAQACIDQRCHYIDIGDGRNYVSGIRALHERAAAQGVFVCAGASTSPAVSSAAVAELQPNFQRIKTIKVALTAGNKNQAGVSTIASILSYAGRPVRVWQDRRWQTIPGWGAGEFLDFPAPVGRRRAQVCDMPDLELFPEHFGADSVVFKAGVELTLFNYAFAALANLRRARPSLDLARLAVPLTRMSGLFKTLGTWHGGLAVWATGDDGLERSIALVARRNGPRVASAAAVLLARKIIAGHAPDPGAYPCVGFLSMAELAVYLAPFDIFVAHGRGAHW